jgi:iron complex transport system ATP-binding protein
MSLHVSQLNHHRGGQTLLQNINARIDEPVLIGIIGPNGAGKSTLLHCLTGLVPTRQNITLNDQPLETYSQTALAGLRAVLAQDNHVNFPFLAKDIVGMSFAFSSLSSEQQAALTRQCLDMVSANALADRQFLSLSGGEKQRIHLARVMAQLLQDEPSEAMRYLFLDEPTAPLDLKHQHQLFKHLKQLRKQNICVITVIHDINLAAACCDQLWVMHDSRLTHQGTPQEVITAELMKQVFGVEVHISSGPSSAKPVISTL